MLLNSKFFPQFIGEKIVKNLSIFNENMEKSTIAYFLGPSCM